MVAPKPQKKRFNVLARPQSIDAEVRTRTVVFEQAWPAHGQPVCFSAGGLHTIVAVRLSTGPFQDLGDRARRPLPPFGNLLLDQHSSKSSFFGLRSQHSRVPASGRDRRLFGADVMSHLCRQLVEGFDAVAQLGGFLKLELAGG